MGHQGNGDSSEQGSLANTRRSVRDAETASAKTCADADAAAADVEARVRTMGHFCSLVHPVYCTVPGGALIRVVGFGFGYSDSGIRIRVRVRVRVRVTVRVTEPPPRRRHFFFSPPHLGGPLNLSP